MSIDPASVGTVFPLIVFPYDHRDVMFYALSVGCGPSEFDYVYEGRGPKVLPTFAVVPPFEMLFASTGRMGMDLTRLVHGEQGVELFGPIPPRGELHTLARVDAIWDKGRHAIGVVKADTRLAGHDEILFTTTWTLLVRGAGGFGGEPGPSVDRPSAPDGVPATFRCEHHTLPIQALLYRLNGDRNPLHADPDFAKLARFDRPILHGLCTMGYAGRALVQHLGGDPGRLAKLDVRFTAPVFPGDRLITEGWELESGEIVIEMRTGADSLVLTGVARAG